MHRRLLQLSRIGVWLLIRQSSERQRRQNPGSALVQRAQAKVLRPLGISAPIEMVDARGETGRGDKTRHRFLELLNAAQEGRVGILVLARHDRLGRNTTDSDALFQALKKHGALIVVQGRVFDPRTPQDKMNLNLYANLAEFDNDQRSQWFQMTRWAMAQRHSLRVALPTGLVWASPEDATYRAAMRAAGLSHWLERLTEGQLLYRAAARKTHDTLTTPSATHAGQQIFYPLPFPDRDVVRAAELRLEWLLQTRDLRAVLERIGAPYVATRGAVPIASAHADWPRPGYVPVMRTHGATWHPGMTPEWVPVERTALRRWYASPALFGTYRFSSALHRADHAEDGGGSDAEYDEESVFEGSPEELL